MIRIMHTALVFLFVAAALLGYGAKEETRALGKEIKQLESQRKALQAEIALLKAEWDHVTSADFLIAAAARLDGEGPLRDAEGRALAPWRSVQMLDLSRPPLSRSKNGPTRKREAKGDFGVASIPKTGPRAPLGPTANQEIEQ